jgi:UDP-N-acetylmuramoyl-tripeptide--D-alanyl-D-alanine ligase
LISSKTVEPLDFLEVCKALGGRLESSNPPLLEKVCGVSIDTRTLKPGGLFFAFSGSKTDGHFFVNEALKKGAVGCVVSRPVEGVPKERLIFVEDVQKALMRLGAWYREKIDVPIIGITGSSGKSTTKELTAHLLSLCFPVLKAHESYNNEIGVPLTLLSWSKEKKGVVLELAMRGKGHIAQLCEISRPTWGLITSIGEAHIGLLGSVQAIADAKGELLEALSKDGLAFLNAEDAWTPYLEKKASCSIRTFGFQKSAWVYAEKIQETSNGIKAELNTPFGKTEIFLNLLGRHNLLNFLGASAIALSFGVPLEKIQEGASICPYLHGRLVSLKGKNGIVILDDSYNANPSALKAGLQTCASLFCEGKKVLALGDMLELGDFAKEAHASVGKLLLQSNFQALFTIGPLAEYAYEEAKRLGIEAYHFSDHETMLEALRQFLKPNDLILVKGSRKMSMEKIVEGLKEE